MLKNTIKKVFHKDFVHNIWKIEVNGYAQQLAVETRNPETTIPTFHIVNYKTGNTLMAYTPDAKEWTMERVQKDFLILKKVGDQTPTKEGIQVIRISTEDCLYTDYGHVLLDVFEDDLNVRPRSISQGGEILLSIETGQLSVRANNSVDHLPNNRVIYPIPYPKVPTFLQDIAITGDACVSRIDNDRYVWAYHTRQENSYTLHAMTTSTSVILSQEVIQSDLRKMFLQPYFQVGQQIFFMADNNHEIVSYLV